MYFTSAGGREDRTRLMPKGVTLTWAAELGLAGGRKYSVCTTT